MECPKRMLQNGRLIIKTTKIQINKHMAVKILLTAIFSVIYKLNKLLKENKEYGRTNNFRFNNSQRRKFLD